MYQDRSEAGRIIAQSIADRGFQAVSLLSVPRGGVVVAAPVARELGARLGVLVTRKIGHPANPEVAVGAVMADGTAVLDDKLIDTYAISPEYLKQAIAREHLEIKRRMLVYTGSDKPLAVAGKTAIIVDDGIATGYTVRAAVKWIKTLGPAAVIIAVPVTPPDTVAELACEVDEIICPLQPAMFMAVGMYYRDFPQTTDAEVLTILKAVNNPA